MTRRLRLFELALLALAAMYNTGSGCGVHANNNGAGPSTVTPVCDVAVAGIGVPSGVDAPPHVCLAGEDSEICVDDMGRAFPKDGNEAQCTKSCDKGQRCKFQCLPLCERGKDKGFCLCRDFGSKFPPGTFDPFKGQKTTGACFPEDRDGDRCTGCSAIIHYAWPGCANSAEVSGYLIGNPSTSLQGFANSGDDDTVFSICPDETTMIHFPFGTSPPQELRNFFPIGYGGNMHIESQECRLYDGTYKLTLGDGTVVFQNEAARPKLGDFISLVGDWITDDYHPGNGAEIHEARLRAVTRSYAANNSVSASFLNGYFVKKTDQESTLELDIQIPLPTDPTLTKLKCTPLYPGETGPNGEVVDQTPFCGVKPAVSRTAPTATILTDMTGKITNAFCHVRFDLTAPNSIQPLDFNCQGTCDGHAFSEDNLAAGFCASRLAITGVIKADWTDPSDLWQCDCNCDDPSSPGAVIAARIQGCTPFGLDITKPTDQQTGCKSVCQNAGFCGLSEACVVGECNTPTPGGSPPDIVIEHACDPTLDQPRQRPASAGDYRLTLDASSSTMTILTSGRVTTTQPVSGQIFFNLRNPTGTTGTLDFAGVRLSAPAFSANGTNVGDEKLAIAERLSADLSNASFTIQPNGAVLGVRGIVNGKLEGQNVRNPEVAQGIVDLAGRTFNFVTDARDPDPASNLGLHLELSGTIDNFPPVAVSGGPARTVECVTNGGTGTSVTLDGSGSFDSDPGDAISHYQWFTGSGVGVGNHATEVVTLPLGLASFMLHVYDRKLGASQAPLAVTVADTTPPTLTVSPTSICMWPPNHRRVRFALSDFHPQSTDACDPAPQVRIVSVVSNEADNGLGDGDTSGDVGFSPNAFCVRRERSGTGTGRVYTVTVEARDQSGNATTQRITVNVPHDQSDKCSSAPTTEIADAAACL